jgi:hypothetical protein
MNIVRGRIQTLLQKGELPQRVILSGANVEYALELAAQLQGRNYIDVERGIDSDTLVVRDNGKSLKIDYSDAARRDEQGAYENVRGIIRWMNRKPTVSPNRIVVIENIERITRDAPHALLKIIEEPPEYGRFLFTTQNHHQMLETILSRMVVFSVGGGQKELVEPDDTVVAFLGEWNLFEAFAFFETLTKADKKASSREKALAWVSALLLYVRGHATYVSLLPLVLGVHQDLNSNLNVRFTLERMALKVFDWKE